MGMLIAQIIGHTRSRRFYVIKYYYMNKKDLMIWATIRKLYYKALINTSWT